MYNTSNELNHNYIPYSTVYLLLFLLYFLSFFYFLSYLVGLHLSKTVISVLSMQSAKRVTISFPRDMQPTLSRKQELVVRSSGNFSNSEIHDRPGSYCDLFQLEIDFVKFLKKTKKTELYICVCV